MLIASMAAHGGRVRVGHLVGVVTGPSVGLLVDADVAMRLDEAGEHPLAGRVDDDGVGREHNVGA